MNTSSFEDHLAATGAAQYIHDAVDSFQKIPGSAIIIRYIRSSYQNDPVRSAVELFLIIFAIYYLLAPAYSTTKQRHVPLTDEVGHIHWYAPFVAEQFGRK